MIYLEASVLVAATTVEPLTEYVVGLLQMHRADQISVSEWCVTEAASALAIKERTGQIMEEERVASLSGIRTLIAASVSILPVASRDMRQATAFIERSELPLRGGDALHLAIAAEHRAMLWTLDRKMAAAAKMLGLDVRLLVAEA